LGDTVRGGGAAQRRRCELIAFREEYRRDWLREIGEGRGARAAELRRSFGELAPAVEGYRIARARLAKTDVLRASRSRACSVR